MHQSASGSAAPCEEAGRALQSCSQHGLQFHAYICGTCIYYALVCVQAAGKEGERLKEKKEEGRKRKGREEGAGWIEEHEVPRSEGEEDQQSVSVTGMSGTSFPCGWKLTLKPSLEKSLVN